MKSRLRWRCVSAYETYRYRCILLVYLPWSVFAGYQVLQVVRTNPTSCLEIGTLCPPLNSLDCLRAKQPNCRGYCPARKCHRVAICIYSGFLVLLDVATMAQDRIQRTSRSSRNWHVLAQELSHEFKSFLLNLILPNPNARPQRQAVL